MPSANDLTFRALMLVGAIGLLFWPRWAIVQTKNYFFTRQPPARGRYLFATVTTIAAGAIIFVANLSPDVRIHFFFTASAACLGLWAIVRPGRRPVASQLRQNRNRKTKTSAAKKENSFTRSRAWRTLRYQVLRRYGSKCMLCGSTQRPLHVDHIKPRARYPELALEFQNLQVLCEACNLGKSDRFEDDFRQARKK